MPKQRRIALAIRLRNEWPLLRGLLNALQGTCEEAWVLDDASTEPCPPDIEDLVGRLVVLRAPRWSGLDDEYQEGIQRDFLIQQIKRKSSCGWILQLDADERIADPALLRALVQSPEVDAWVLPLVDFYITPHDAHLIDTGAPQSVREWFGVETRWTLSLFRALPGVYVSRGDVREPQGFASGRVRETAEPIIEHYGKAISVAEWERKADFYATRYPAFRDKWLERRGKAVHDQVSDFATPLVHRHEPFHPGSAPVVHRYAIEHGWRPKVKTVVFGWIGSSRLSNVAR